MAAQGSRAAGNRGSGRRPVGGAGPAAAAPLGCCCPAGLRAAAGLGRVWQPSLLGWPSPVDGLQVGLFFISLLFFVSLVISVSLLFLICCVTLARGNECMYTFEDCCPAGSRVAAICGRLWQASLPGWPCMLMALVCGMCVPPDMPTEIAEIEKFWQYRTVYSEEQPHEL